MYWHEEEDVTKPFVPPDDVVDLSFDIQCRTLPVDHAYALSQAIQKELPWFADETLSGLHVIHGAETGNGWERPQGPDALLHLSRRTKLVLRLPKTRVQDAQDGLSDKILDIDGHKMAVGKAKQRLLAVTTTLYSRSMVSDPEQSEEAFIGEQVAALKAMGLRFKKVLCGKSNNIQTPDAILATRSLLVAEMSFEDSVRLQEQGLGAHKALGCGIFTAHKTLG